MPDVSTASRATRRPAAPPPLVTAVVEVEAHADAAGWDQPARIYALVPTDELLAREPALATTLGLDAAAAAGRRHCVLRLRSRDDALLQGPDLVPRLTVLLQDTLDGPGWTAQAGRPGWTAEGDLTG
ncbi:MAG: hypothetical protein M3P83_07545 [Actinomycetota bacterium]|nr:hypothetical protein [Actinomycetota bacterium]